MGLRRRAYALGRRGALWGSLGLAALLLLSIAPPALGRSADATRPAVAGPSGARVAPSAADPSGLSAGAYQALGLGSTSDVVLTLGSSAYTSWPSSATLPGDAGTSLVYDPAIGTFLAFGGVTTLPNGTSVDSDATWAYANGSWVRMCATSDNASDCAATPSARAGALLVWDAADHEVLLTGGWATTSSGAAGGLRGGFNDLWSFSGDQWSNLSSGAPLGIWDGAMTYDSEDGYVLAVTSGGGTYSYSEGSWNRVTSPKESPPARAFPAMFDDPTLGGVVLYGGIGAKNVTVNDTWLYRDGDWARIPDAHEPSAAGIPAAETIPASTSAAYDPNLGEGIVFDPSGTGGATTWAFSNGSWSNRTASLVGPSTSAGGASLSWDPESGYGMLLTSPGATGPEAGFLLSDPLVIALGSTNAVMDAGQSHLFTPALSDGLVPYGTAWTSAPAGCGLSGNLSATPDVSCSESQPGPVNFTLTFSDAAGRSGRATFRLTVHADPTVAISEIVPDPTSAGIPVTFGADPALGTPPYEALAWTFDAGAPVYNATPMHTFDRAGNQSVEVRLVDAVGFSVEARTTLTVNPDPDAVLALNRSMSSAGLTDVGLPLAFSASTYGGTGTVACAWNFGDGSTSSVCDPDHAFASAGAHAVSFFANDSVGAGFQENLTVPIAPSVAAALAPVPSGAAVDAYLAFGLSASGGIGAYAINWSFGDGGTATGTNVSHAYGIPGTYEVVATVTDQVGGRVVEEEQVEVAPALPGGAPGSTAPPTGDTGSLLVPSGPRSAPAPADLPWLIVEAALAIALASGTLLVDRRRSRPASRGWVRRIARGLRNRGPGGPD